MLGCCYHHWVCYFAHGIMWNQGNSDGIRVTKAIAKYAPSYRKDKHMLTGNNNDYHNEREKKVLDLYNQGKTTRYIAKEIRMSLRDISIILRKKQVSHGIAIIKDNGNDNNNNNKSPNEKATRAYRLFSEGKKPFEDCINQVSC